MKPKKMLRLRLQELIEDVNRIPDSGRRLHIKDVAEAIGVARTTLSSMTTFAGERATNTAIVEALIRYFARELPGFKPCDLFDFQPPLGADAPQRVDDLYPARAARNRPRG